MKEELKEEPVVKELSFVADAGYRHRAFKYTVTPAPTFKPVKNVAYPTLISAVTGLTTYGVNLPGWCGGPILSGFTGINQFLHTKKLYMEWEALVRKHIGGSVALAVLSTARQSDEIEFLQANGWEVVGKIENPVHPQRQEKKNCVVMSKVLGRK